MDTKIYSTSRRGFLKGVAVGAGAYALGSSLIHPEEVMGQSIEGYLEKVPIGDCWSVAAAGLLRNQVMLFKTILDKEGREKYIAYQKRDASLAAVHSKGYADRLGFTGNDAKSAGAIIPAILTIVYGPREKFEIEATAEKARVKCTNCELWNEVQAQKITDDLCSVRSRDWWDGFVKAINPRLTATMVKARPLGDSVCEWVIELKA
ncbi:MAG TPA: twin-arginine translocation signal domain-containing protein [Thermodesulfobacteriota bacterium]|nr:twin-arginine translocation signal domain-containing protein [Thermodesulfobacteriota bacterium]